MTSCRTIDGDELVLYYQPIVALATNEPVGVEALVRWQHPTRGLLAPDEFISMAEKTGLIVALGVWVLDRACAQLCEWSDTAPGLTGLTVNINVSASEVHQPDFVAGVTAILERHRINPGDVVLELTESSNLIQETGAAARLQALRALGIRIAIDDFGTGHFTLSYLRQVPFDIIKIDRSFVDGISDDPDSRIIAEAIVRLGHALKLDVIAEGIETYGQQQALEQMSCRYGQGYHLARPQSATGTIELLVERTRQHRSA